MRGHRRRYREVAETLSRHGLGFLVGAFRFERLVPFHRGLLNHERRARPYTNPEHLRLALEQLGPVFVKLGQLLSTRPDLLPEEYQVELARLQDDAPPVPSHVIRDLVRHELGSEPEEVFAAFDLVALASASIGQVHAAQLQDGTDVVVKVRRPDVEAQVEEDLEILQVIAQRAARYWGAAADYDLVGLVAEFAATLRDELDYLREGHNAERISLNFRADPNVHIPAVFWQTTTSGILTLERISGVKVSDVDGLQDADIDRRDLAERATRVACKMIFEDGFFHADPHPGNLFIESGGQIGLIDFGMVGEVDERLREQLADLLLALTRSDPNRVTAAVLELSVTNSDVDRLTLQKDLAVLLDRYGGLPIGEIPVAMLINEMMRTLRHHHLQLSRQLALILKMLVMTEGMGVSLNPEFRLGDVLAPYAEHLTLERLSPDAFVRQFVGAGVNVVDLGKGLPDYARRVVRLLEAGGIEVHLRATEVERLLARMERANDRLVAGVVTAAFIEGVADIMAADQEHWRGWRRSLLLAGVGAAGVLSAYLVWTTESQSRLERMSAVPTNPRLRSAHERDLSL